MKIFRICNLALAVVFVAYGASAGTANKAPYQFVRNLAAKPKTQCKRLSSYCITAQGNIAACDSTTQCIKIIDTADNLVAEWKPGFAPQVIVQAQDGTYVVAGPGKVARLAADGKVIVSGDLPTPKGLGRAASAGVGVMGKDVFVACRANTGYNIYRLAEDLTSATQIVKGLRGCCGQMDIEARDGIVYVAANCNFEVSKYDREGKKLGKIGKSARSINEGFCGCCEPKNVAFTPSGELLTSESEKCTIKRFAKDGSFEIIGRGHGISGCVRVTVAMSADEKSLFLLDKGKNRIQVLEKND